ncbi:C4-dicarboxylate ABC transporter [Clostridiales bacterium COT073_COT-073]|nr:C4-dicarboxylate ABC transporter [Clostridiales bacterium COT073_COT-073]
MKRISKLILSVVVAVLLVIGVSTFFSVNNSIGSDKIHIRMAHGQAGNSEIGGTIAYLSELVAEDESMGMEVSIYPGGVLGSETAMIELAQAGVLDMAKISANTVGQFDDRYRIFSLPYLFVSQDHYYRAMENSEVIRELFEATKDAGYIAIGYYCNGSRNFYLKENVAVTDPSVLKGKKIRSMVSSTSMDMIEAMGGSPVPMSSSETYTSLQQGIVDGAENTELALTVDKHEEIVRSYTYTEHQYTPDIYVISTKTWNRLSDKQKEYLMGCFLKLNENFVQQYNRMMSEAIEEAQSYGVTVYRDIDKSAFIEAVQPIHEAFRAKGQEYQALYDDIQKYAKEGN